ncbi:hypothetical protein PO124_16290 [Bacillus licheniformis]|nr:hypothetical protein [Bacillus licheniformis]
MLASAGGVTVSYLSGCKTTRDSTGLKKKLKNVWKMMVKSFNNIYEMAHNRRIDMRLAAYMVGVRKMAEASRFRGWI